MNYTGSLPIKDLSIRQTPTPPDDASRYLRPCRAALEKLLPYPSLHPSLPWTGRSQRHLQPPYGCFLPVLPYHDCSFSERFVQSGA